MPLKFFQAPLFGTTTGVVLWVTIIVFIVYFAINPFGIFNNFASEVGNQDGINSFLEQIYKIFKTIVGTIESVIFFLSALATLVISIKIIKDKKSDDHEKKQVSLEKSIEVTDNLNNIGALQEAETQTIRLADVAEKQLDAEKLRHNETRLTDAFKVMKVRKDLQDWKFGLSIVTSIGTANPLEFHKQTTNTLVEFGRSISKGLNTASCPHVSKTEKIDFMADMLRAISDINTAYKPVKPEGDPGILSVSKWVINDGIKNRIKISFKSFENVHFDHCNFNSLSFSDSNLYGCTFSNSINITAYGCLFSNVGFSGMDTGYSQAYTPQLQILNHFEAYMWSDEFQNAFYTGKKHAFKRVTLLNSTNKLEWEERPEPRGNGFTSFVLKGEKGQTMEYKNIP